MSSSFSSRSITSNRTMSHRFFSFYNFSPFKELLSGTRAVFLIKGRGLSPPFSSLPCVRHLPLSTLWLPFTSDPSRHTSITCSTRSPASFFTASNLACTIPCNACTCMVPVKFPPTNLLPSPSNPLSFNASAIAFLKRRADHRLTTAFLPAMVLDVTFHQRPTFGREA